jgi:hypothetical protein
MQEAFSNFSFPGTFFSLNANEGILETLLSKKRKDSLLVINNLTITTTTINSVMILSTLQ